MEATLSSDRGCSQFLALRLKHPLFFLSLEAIVMARERELQPQALKIVVHSQASVHQDTIMVTAFP
jgi:hypothetical protein